MAAPSKKDLHAIGLAVPVVDAWASETADEIAGNEIVDKEELVDKPFMIRGMQWRMSANQDYELVDIDAELPNGTLIQFNDSSSNGIKGQLEKYLADKGLSGKVDAREYITVNIKCLRGLRKSSWQTKDARGKSVAAKAFYIRLKPEDK